MIVNFVRKSFLIVALLGSVHGTAAASDHGHAPEATEAEAVLPFRDIPILENAYIDTTPADRKDGVTVGELGVDGGDQDTMVAFAQEIADGQYGSYDSLLIAHKGKLVFESYYLHGHINLPHTRRR
ncbi:MAG: hypothetical protein AAF608_03110 [Pseudomonadota bacterium]